MAPGLQGGGGAEPPAAPPCTLPPVHLGRGTSGGNWAGGSGRGNWELLRALGAGVGTGRGRRSPGPPRWELLGVTGAGRGGHRSVPPPHPGTHPLAAAPGGRAGARPGTRSRDRAGAGAGPGGSEGSRAGPGEGTAGPGPPWGGDRTGEGRGLRGESPSVAPELAWGRTRVRVGDTAAPAGSPRGHNGALGRDRGALCAGARDGGQRRTPGSLPGTATEFTARGRCPFKRRSLPF